ncbi:MAG: hypothetical protein ACJ72U_17640 [Nitrososphaeraceae archaeon]
MKWNIPLKTAVGNGTFELSHRMATSSIRDEVQEQAAKDAAHREIAMCLLSSHMLLNWLLLERIILFFESILRC